MNAQTTKYTPGPWRVEETGGALIGAPMVVAGRHGSVKERRTSTYREIAQVRYYFGSEDASLVEANAKLIAAAPLLLEELQKTQWVYHHVHGMRCPSCGVPKEKFNGQHAAYCELDAAIKAATGE